MILFVREYTHGKSPEINWDVIHETNGKRRWYFYCESGGGIPKTVQKFIEGKTPMPYEDKILHEVGVKYWREA